MSNTTPSFIPPDRLQSSVAGTPSYTEGTQAICLAPSAAVFDAELAALDGDAGNYAGAVLTLSRVGGASAEDLFSGLGGLSLAGGVATVGGVAVGTVSNAAGVLSVSFNGQATQARVDEVLRGIGYANSSDVPPTSVALQWSFNDGSGEANAIVIDSTTVALRNVDDPATGRLILTGEARVGSTLSVTNTVFDVEGMLNPVLTWYLTTPSGRHAIYEPTGGSLYHGTTYTVQARDIEQRVSVELDYTDVYGNLRGWSSNYTGPVVTNTANAPATGTVTVSGTPVQGQTLSVTYELADPDGMGTPRLEWLRDGQIIPEPNNGGTTFTLTQDDVGKAISVRAIFADLHGFMERVTSNSTAKVANVNDAPTGGVQVFGQAVQGQTLTAQHNIVDPDGAPWEFLYQWLRDGMEVAGASRSTYKLGEADVGHAVSVRVSYTDKLGTAESVSSAATAAVANLSDAAVAPAIVGMARQGEVLKAGAPVDSDGVNALAYQWLRDGQAVDGATGTSYTLTQSDVGHVFALRASYTDNYGSHESLTSAATAAVANVNDRPYGGITLNQSSFVQGDKLTATPNIVDPDGMGPVTWQWMRGTVAIAGATGQSYTLTQADVGKSIAVQASWVDGGGTTETFTGQLLNPVQDVDDAPTGSVVVSGTATQGQTLTVSNNLADVDGLGLINYTWTRDGFEISGALKASYVLSQADVGHAISVYASYTDKMGHYNFVRSTASAPVANANDAPAGGVTVGGAAKQGLVLSAVTAKLVDADGLGALSYQWLRGGVAVDGATAATYSTTQADVGQALSVRVSYTDGQGTAESVTSAATAAVANVNDAATGDVTVSGTATQGQVLTAAHTLADIDGLGTVSYQWLRAGKAIAGATGASYTLAQDDVGKAISVKASYVDGGNTAESRVSAATAAVANVNDAVTGGVTVSGTAAQGQTLTAANTLADADGLGTIKYQWLRDGVAITGATAGTYVLKQADVGHAIAARAAYVDKLGTAEAVTSDATALVANVNDAPTGGATVGGVAKQGGVLSAVTAKLVDADGLGAFSYQWLRGGVAVDGATGATYTTSQADVGQAVSVRVSYTDGYGAAETVTSSASAPVANVNDAPTGGVTVSGTATQGQVLTASNTLADIDGMGAVTYQWLRAGKAIADATGASYTLTQDDVGKAISVKASYVDGFNKAEAVTSAATAVVANVNDAPTGGVTVSGTATQGQTLTAANTLADIDGLGAIKYQWLRDGAAITGATAATYVLKEADVGHAIAARAAYVDKLGTAEAVTSDATAPVANVNDAPTGGVTVSGLAKQGVVLSAVTAKLADADGLGALSYQWLRGGVAVDGATAATYTTTQADVGQAVSVRVSYADGHGTAEAVTSSATAAVANVNDVATGSVTLSGTAEVGRALSASFNLQDLDGMGTVALQWLRAGTAIAGATGASYTLTAADADKAIAVRASFVDLLGGKEAVTSAATAAVAYGGDTVTGTAGADALHGGLGASVVDGGAGNDSLWGEAGNDTVIGGAGNDTLYGGVGNDVLQGDAGDDRLLGGAGVDTLSGGDGRDSFAFPALAELGATAATADVITDFVRGQDRIDLVGLDANTATAAREAFSAFIDASAAFTAAGQLKFADGVLYGNTDADADAEFAIRLLGVSALDLSDFVLR